MMMKLRVAKQAKEVCTIFCDAEEALVIMMVAAAAIMKNFAQKDIWDFFYVYFSFLFSEMAFFSNKIEW